MKKKKFKGMTLVEVIIAIAVLGVAGLIMAKIGQAAAITMYRTNHLNTKINDEAPTVSVKRVENIDESVDGLGDVTIAVDSYGTYTAKKYSTGSLADTEDAADTRLFQGNLEFYVIETETETTP